MRFLSALEFPTLYKLLGYVIRHRPGVIAVTLLGVVSSMIELVAMAFLLPLSALASGQALGPHSRWRDLAHIFGFGADAKFFIIVFLALLLVRVVTSGIATMLTNHTHRALIAHFSSRALEAFANHLTFEQVQKGTIGHFITLAGDEANRASQIIVALMKLTPIFVLFGLYLALVIYQAWVFGVSLILFFVITAATLSGAFKLSHALGKRQQDESRALNTHFIESLSGLRTVRAFNAEEYVCSRYDRMIRNYAWTCFSVDALNLLSRLLPAIFLMLVALVCVVLFVNQQWLVDNLAYGFVSAMMVLRLLPAAGQGLDGVMKLTADLRAARNVSEMLDAVNESSARAAIALPSITSPISSIEFNHVDFRYAQDAPWVLQKFSAKFEAGKSYAIVGPSGAGKSSLIDLLLKFFVPISGAIRINGLDISQIDSRSIRGRVVLAEQATRIFYDTVLQNVLFGKEASSDDVLKAVDSVGLSEFLSALPQGLATMLNYQGNNISGGQRQRIGLARAFLRSGDVLVLDETTNALDRVVRESVVRNVLESYRDRIVIFVTHDPYVVERVSEVIHVNPK